MVPRGTSYVLVGHEGAGKRAVLRSLTGELRPEEGKVLVFGLDPRRERREIKRRLRSGELVATDESFVRGAGATVFATTTRPELVAGADQVGFMREGRLVLDGSIPRVLARFRRIRYVNEITEARTEYGNELDAFDAVRVRVRGWGVEAVVSNFDEAGFEHFRAIEGVTDASAEPMSLEEIFEAVAGKTPPGI